MTVLLLGLLVFFTVHLYSTFRTRRAGSTIIDRIGYPVYMSAYSVASAVGLGLIAYGYSIVPPTQPIYGLPIDVRPVTIVGMAFASICVAAAYSPANHIARTLRHPMLVGVGLWSASHLIAPTEVKDFLLFGSFLAYAIVDIFVVNTRRPGAANEEAISTVRGDVIAVTVGLGAFAIIAFWLHAALIGVGIW